MEHLKGLSGGQKQKWLRENRAIVLNFMKDHNDIETMQEFRMTRFTYNAFLSRNNDNVDFDKLSKADRALLISQSSNERVIDIGHEVAHLRRQLDALMPAIKLMYALSAVMRMAGSLQSLPADFDSKSGKLKLD